MDDKARDIINQIGAQINENALKCLWEIALICKHSDYPEDLEEIYDVLVKYGIDYTKVRED